MILDLEGRRAVVTGGSRGLGYGIAQALHDSGAEVIITGRTGKVWEAAAEIGSSGPPAYGVTGDLSRQQQRETVCEQILEIYNGRVDILVNAAGTLNRCAAFEVTQEDWNEVVELNLNAVFFMSQRIGRSMAGRPFGKNINTIFPPLRKDYQHSIHGFLFWQCSGSGLQCQQRRGCPADKSIIK